MPVAVIAIAAISLVFALIELADVLVTFARVAEEVRPVAAEPAKQEARARIA